MFYTSFWKIGASVFTSKKYMSLKHKLVNNFVTNRDKVVPLPCIPKKYRISSYKALPGIIPAF